MLYKRINIEPDTKVFYVARKGNLDITIPVRVVENDVSNFTEDERYEIVVLFNRSNIYLKGQTFRTSGNHLRKTPIKPKNSKKK